MIKNEKYFEHLQKLEKTILTAINEFGIATEGYENATLVSFLMSTLQYIIKESAKSAEDEQVIYAMLFEKYKGNK